jgi:hypothetical protein
MIDNFPKFAEIVAASFQRLVKADKVFVTAAEPDALYATYLGAFPEGTNPRYKERTEHDCSCCKQFVRRAGNAVAVGEDGRVRTIWDAAAEKAPYPYNQVAAALRDKIKFLEKKLKDGHK